MPVVISIHAPLAGCDLKQQINKRNYCNFNPRTPCGVRRPSSRFGLLPITFQSTHPLRGATYRTARLGIASTISIHAPLAGCDAEGDIKCTQNPHFNPRTPCGVRQDAFGDYRYVEVDFNPRTPCGVRQNRSHYPQLQYRFQSTHPLRGATGVSNMTAVAD